MCANEVTVKGTVVVHDLYPDSTVGSSVRLLLHLQWNWLCWCSVNWDVFLSSIDKIRVFKVGILKRVHHSTIRSKIEIWER